MATDWPAQIGNLIRAKQIIAEHDRDLVFPWHLPEVGASESDVEQMERTLGVSLPDEFKRFLTFANGWRCVLVRANLHGVRDLTPHQITQIIAREDVRGYLADSGLTPRSVLPIGSSETERTVYLMLLAQWDGLPVGAVLWIDCEEIERFASFEDFFTAMTAHNYELGEEVRAGKWAL